MERRYTYTYTIELSPAEAGGYMVTVPALPGCHTQGKTYEEAVAHAEEAVQGFLETLRTLGRPIPIEEQARRLHLQVSLATPA